VYQAVLGREFGPAWLTWEPETLWAEINRVWSAAPTGEVRSKILATRACIVTDLFYTDAPAFENMVLAVNDLQYDPGEVQLASPEEMVYAVRVMSPLKDGTFGREVVGYVRTCCRKSGLLRYPDDLRFAEPEYPPDLAKYAAQIKAEDGGDNIDPTSIVGVQSDLLYRINVYVADKMAQMAVDALQPSTA